MSDIRSRAVEVGNSVITVDEVLSQFKRLASKLAADTMVQISAREGYRSRYEILDELKTKIKDTPSDPQVADLVGRTTSGSAEYSTLEQYINTLRPTQFEPTLAEGQSSIVDPNIIVYYTPNYPNKDPRRTGRYLSIDPTQALKSIDTKTWLLNNSMLYGFLVYADTGLYYESLPKIRQYVRNGSTVAKIASRYLINPIDNTIITTTTQMVLGTTSTNSPIVPSELEYVVGTPVLDNDSNRPKLLVVDNTVVTEPLVESFFSMRDAAAQEGISLKIVSGFRPAFGPNVTLETTKGRRIVAVTQESIRRNRSTWRGRSDWTGDDESFVFQAPSNYFSPTAAKPGTSKHGSGLALDLNTSSKPHLNNDVYIWLVKNAHQFGFVRTVSTEEWHFEYIPSRAALGPYAMLADTNANRFYSDLGLSGLPA